MSKTHLPYRVIWDGDNFIDGMECETFEKAKNDALDTLVMWQTDEFSRMTCKFENGKFDFDFVPEEQKEQWDYMIENCMCWVEKLKEDYCDNDDNCDEDELYEEYWYPSDEDLKMICWISFEEMKNRYARITSVERFIV